MSNEKKCTCEKPETKQPIMPGYKGLVKCSKCNGLFDHVDKPAKTSNDPVEQYVFNLEANQTGMIIELAILKMLLRIEKALKKR